MSAANNLLIDLAEQAMCFRLLMARRPEKFGKPGEFFNNLSEDQKTILRQLRSSDISIRLDLAKLHIVAIGP